MTDDSLQAYILKVFAPEDSGRVWVAYSGGGDSTALLHLALECLPRDRIIAVHVNHNLHPNACEWEQFCRDAVARLGVDFRSLQVRVEDGDGVESAARDARYTALKTLLRKGDVLMTAHHGDDQAETVLLQMLRGGGPAGLAAMPRRARLGAGSLLRPLLEVARLDIDRFVCRHKLEYIDDPANDDLRYDRSYLRRMLVPLLSARWPAWQKTLARVARHQGEASHLIRQLAQQAYRHCRSAGDTLLVERCRELSDAERKAVLRYWIKCVGLPVPAEKHLEQLIKVFLSQVPRSATLVTWPGAEIHHYRGKLYAMAPRAANAVFPSGVDSLRWLRGTDLRLPGLGIELNWKQLRARAPVLADAEFLTVRLRCGGERCVRARIHKKLKKVFQELGVPTWERSRVPLIYLGDELRLVWFPTDQG